MHFNARLLFFPALFVINGVLAQLSGEPTSGSPAVTYPTQGTAFVFCSDQDCTGTCELVDGEYLTATLNDGEAAPNSMGFQSIYWYDPGDAYPLVLYTCVSYYVCDPPVNVGPNTCYNLYDNGVPTDFGWYWYEAASGFRV